MEAPGYWDDVEKSQEGMKELNRLKEEKQAFEGLQRSYEDIETLLEMGYEENDESLIPEIEEELNQFVETFESMRIRTLLSGEYDKEDAIVTLHAGAGGTESCDWTGMLYRMYSRWAESHGFSVEVLDYLESIKPVRAVYGNIDGQEIRLRTSRHLRFSIEGADVWMTHIGGYPGHYAPDVVPEIYRRPPRLFVTGHSHILKVMYDKTLDCLHINPGAAGLSGFHRVRTALRFVIDGERIEELEVGEWERRSIL